MRERARLLAAFHRPTWRAFVLVRLARWACLELILLSLWAGACALLRAPKLAFDAVLLFSASLAPVFILWPLPRSRFLVALRRVDRESTVEAWVGAPPGPAADLLAPRATAFLAQARPRPFREGEALEVLRPWLQTAFFVALLVQALSFLLLREPLLGYAGPSLDAGSGLRLAESSGGSSGALPDSGAEARQDPEALVADPGEAGGAGLEGPSAQEVASAGRSQDPAALTAPGFPREERATGAPEGAGSTRPPEGGEAAGDSGARSSPERGAAGGIAGSREGGDEPGATGYEGAGKSGVASPLIDYRTRLLKVLEERDGSQPRASGELDEAELGDFARRYFGTFRLETGIRPREDAWTGALRRRWAAVFGSGP